MRFVVLGVEARSFLLDGQGDRSNLARQGEPRHFRPHSRNGPALLAAMMAAPLNKFFRS